MSSDLLNVRKFREGFLRGFVAGLGLELAVRAFVMLGFLSETFRGFVFVVCWCIYSIYFYYLTAGDKFSHNLAAAVVFGLFFGVLAALVLFVQGYPVKVIPLYLFGFSLLLSWAVRAGVRRERTRRSSSGRLWRIRGHNK